MSTKRKNTSRPPAAGAPAAQVQIRFRQAIENHQAGRLEQARTDYQAVLKAQPRHFEALHLLGAIASQTGDHQQAVDLIGQAIAIHPHNPGFHSNRGVSFQELKQMDAAIASYDEAIRLKPDYALAYYNRGIALQGLGRPEAAIASYERAIEIKPEYTEAYFSRGNALAECKRYEAAIDSYNLAIGLNPRYAQAYGNRGFAHRELQQPETAIADYDRAIALDPQYLDAHYNRANLLKEFNQLDAAIAGYDRVISLRPDYPEAHLNKSLALLLGGNYAEGWDLYEWRWSMEKRKATKRHFPQPLWRNQEPLAGKTLLLYHEQGLGDTIQFVRYVKLAAELGARVVLEIPGSLAGLFKGLPGVDTLAIKGEALPEFDYHCPLLSLPLAFKTELHSIPASQQFLPQDSEKLAHWANKLGTKSRRRVGLVWSGNAEHASDHTRSIRLADLTSHLPPGIQYVSLQKEIRDADTPSLASKDILHFGDELKDFSDTAALCELMDLVISVDTSVAHLSASLGRPTWIPLSFSPDWRWLLGRDDSPWYASVTLYRQQKVGDWGSVFAKIADDLRRFAQ